MPIANEARRCPKCRQKLDPLDDVCPNCGTPVKRNLESGYDGVVGDIFLKGVVGAAVDRLDSGGDANVTFGDVVRFQNKFNDDRMKKGVHYEKKGSYYRFDSGEAPEGAKKAALKAQKRVLTSKAASVMRKTLLPGVILMAVALTAGLLINAEEFMILPCVFAALIAAPSIAVAIGNFMVYRSAKDPARDHVSSSGLSVIRITLFVRMALSAIAVIATLIVDEDTTITVFTLFSGVFLILSDICSAVCLKRLKYEFDTRSQTPCMIKYGAGFLIFLSGLPALGVADAIALSSDDEVAILLRLLAGAASLVLFIYMLCADKLLTDYHDIMLGAIERELRREAEEEPDEPDPEPQTPVCPKCGAQVDRDSAFCMKCGAKIEPPAADVNFCPNCGNKLASGSAFCPNCGNKVAN